MEELIINISSYTIIIIIVDASIALLNNNDNIRLEVDKPRANINKTTKYNYKF
jgi:hypothetical protein